MLQLYCYSRVRAGRVARGQAQRKRLAPSQVQLVRRDTARDASIELCITTGLGAVLGLWEGPGRGRGSAQVWCVCGVFCFGVRSEVAEWRSSRIMCGTAGLREEGTNSAREGVCRGL